VALKILQHPKQHLDAEARTRITREARTLSRLDHPNICRIYDYIDSDDADILVLELIDGRTLEQAMNEGLTRSDKLRIALSIAEVLVVAHNAGIIHRDLKPENVMLTKSGEVKVLDFGLARWLERTQSLRTRAALVHAGEAKTDARWVAIDADTTVVFDGGDDSGPKATAAGITDGTPIYISPEQARGETVTTASDIYAFGLLLQTLFTGKDPYPDGLTAREVMLRAARGDSLPISGIEHNIAAIIRSLKAFAPADRPGARDALRRIRYIVDTPKRYARRIALAAALAIVAFAGWKYVTDLRRERTAAQVAEAEAKHRRAQADSLIEFMLGDLRTKLEPVGRLDILDSAAERSLAYMASLRPEFMTPEEIARNSKALNQLGEVRMAQGNLAAAVGVFRQSLVFAKQAAARDPRNPEFALALGTAHFWVGNAMRVKGDLPGALGEMREYRRVTEDLARHFPGVDSYQQERAYGHSAVGTILEAQRDYANALTEYKLTLQIQSARLAAQPTDTARQSDVAVTLNKIGFILSRIGRLREARSYYEQEFAIYDALTRADPKNMHWKDRLANSHEYLAYASQTLGDLASALRDADVGASLYTELVARDPTNTTWRRNAAAALSRRGLVLLDSGQAAAAEHDIEGAESRIQQLLHQEKRGSWNVDLARIQIASARALAAEGKLREANEKIASALATVAAEKAVDIGTKLDGYIVAAEIAETAHADARAAAAWSNAKTIVDSYRGRSPDFSILSQFARVLIATGESGRGQALVRQIRDGGFRSGDLERFCATRSCE